MPATTRSSAASKSSISTTSRCWRPAKIAASLQMLARSAPVRPLVWRATSSRSTFFSGLLRECTSRISLRPLRSGGGTKIWRSKRPGRSSAGSSFSSRFEAAITTSSSRAAEAVHLDEQLVERLVLLAGDVVAARGAHRVELVDEDDRRPGLACLAEEAPDARRAEAGEHLHERRRPTARRTWPSTRWPRPWQAASCRCPAGRAAGCPSAPSRRAGGSAWGRAGTPPPRAAPPWPPRRRRRRPTGWLRRTPA